MVFLVLSILSSTSIFVLFKLINKYSVKLIPVIIFNYITATIWGLALNNHSISLTSIIISPWFLWAVVIGILFIVFFFMIGISAQKSGILVTTIACKMSVIFPILFSIFFYKEELTFLKISGIMAALSAVFLSVYQKNQKNITSSIKGGISIFLPLFLFIGMGIVDSMVKYCQASYVNDESSPVFTATLFLIAGLSGIIVLPFMKEQFKAMFSFKSILWGIALGTANYGSLYFLIKTLNSNTFESSIVFGINNIGIVSISVLLGLFVFREKMNTVNFIGLAMALISLVILTNY